MVVATASDVVTAVVPGGLVSESAPAFVSVSLPTPEMEEEEKEEEPVVVVDNVVVVVLVVVEVVGWKMNHCEPKTTPRGRGQDHY